MLKDNLLTTRYSKPVELTRSAAVSSHIIRLLMLEPGENQSHPEMGIGIVSRYRYSFKEDLAGLENEITEQIETYLPMLRDVKVKLDYSSDILKISLEVTGLNIKLDIKDDKVNLRDVINT